MNLFATKPLDLLMKEAEESGSHSLKRTLGPFQLTALGVGAVIGAGIFVLSGLGAHYAGPGLMLSFILSGMGCAFAGLCYAEFAAMIPLAGSAYTYAYATLGELFAWIIGWDLTLEYAMGASTVSSGWSNHFIELLDILHIKMPLWLAYDHWTGLRTAENVIARQMAQASDPNLVPGTSAFLDKVGAIANAHSPELTQRATELLNAPTIFGVEVGFNLPAFIIALLITAVLVIGIRESARFNSTIVVIKVSVVLFVIGLGFRYINFANWGHDWSTFAPFGFSGVGAGAAYIFFAYIGFDAVSTTAQEARNPQRDLPIGIIASLLVCTVLYILVAGVLTGMVPWQEVNIEAPIARAFSDRGLTTASHIITLGALAAFPSYFGLLWRAKTNLDDSLDVVAAHGLGGTVGALLTGVFAQKSFNGVADGLLFGNPGQLAIQATAVSAAIVYSGVMSFVLLKVIGLVVPLRTDRENESGGLDQSEHGEEAYVHTGGVTAT